MGGNRVASPPVIDSDEIIAASFRIGYQVAIQENDENARLVEDLDDAAVLCILLGREFERCEENAGNLLHDELLAQRIDILRFFARVCQGFAPQQGMMARGLRLSHSAADRLKN